MTSINLLKVASLPGSGSGCQSALPAEVGRARAKKVEADLFAPGKVVWCTDPVPRDSLEVSDLCAGRRICIHDGVILDGESVITDQVPCDHYKRIFANGKLIYDGRKLAEKINRSIRRGE